MIPVNKKNRLVSAERALLGGPPEGKMTAARTNGGGEAGREKLGDV